MILIYLESSRYRGLSFNFQLEQQRLTWIIMCLWWHRGFKIKYLQRASLRGPRCFGWVLKLTIGCKVENGGSMVERCIVHRSSSCEKGKVFQKTLPRIVERV